MQMTRPCATRLSSWEEGFDLGGVARKLACDAGRALLTLVELADESGAEASVALRSRVLIDEQPAV